MSTELPAKIELNGKLYAECSPDTLAGAFADLNDVEMAQFFDALSDYSTEWKCSRLSQWCGINRYLTDRARKLLSEWAEYFIAETV